MAPLRPTRSRVDVVRAIPDDLEGMARIDAGILGSSGRRALLEEAIRGGACAVARLEGAVVGFALFDRSFFGEAYLPLLIVAADHRRQGVGTALVRHVESLIPGRKLFTSTNRSNLAMQRFCRSLGFVRSGIVDNLDEGDPEIIYFRKARPRRERG